MKIKVIDVGNRFANAQIVSRRIEDGEKKGKAD